MKKKVLGYGFKLHTETLLEAIAIYKQTDLHEDRKAVEDEIKLGKLEKRIPKGSKPKIFKVVVEIQE